MSNTDYSMDMDWSNVDQENLITDHTSFSQLHTAVLENNLDTVRRLVQWHPEVSQYVAFNGETPLFVACSQRDTHIDIVRGLVKANPSAVKVATLDRILPLSKAIVNQRLDIVRLLVENKAPVNDVDLENKTALHLAVADKTINESIVNFLIDETNVDTSIRNSSGKTVLDVLLAKKYRQKQSIRLRIIEKLLDQAVAINQLKVVNTQSLLQYLSFVCNNKYISIDIVKVLHSRIVLSQQNLRDLVFQALQNKRADIVGLFLQHAMQPRRNVVSYKILAHIIQRTPNFHGSGLGPLFGRLKFCSKSKIFDIISLRACSLGIPVASFLKYFDLTPLELNQSDKDGWTMLHHAVHENHLRCVRQLLKKSGVQTRAETFERETALFLGCANKDVQIEIIQALLYRDPMSYRHRNDSNKSVLDLMVENERADLIDLLRSVAVLYNLNDINFVPALTKCITSQSPNIKLIISLASFPVPEAEILPILLLSTSSVYEKSTVQNKLVLENVLRAFYVSGQFHPNSVLKLIRQYLRDLKDPSEFCKWFFMYLVSELPSVTNADAEIQYFSEKNCCCHFKAHAQVILALRCFELDADLLAYASAQGSQLFQCLLKDCIHNDLHCKLAIRILRKLLHWHVIRLNPRAILELLSEFHDDLRANYNYGKHKRVLNLIEQLVLSGLDLGALMNSNELAIVRSHQDVVHRLFAHFVVDRLIMEMPVYQLWSCGLDKSDYFKNRCWTPNVPRFVNDGHKSWENRTRERPKPREEPSSLMRICRNKIYVAIRKNLAIKEYWLFVAMSAYPDEVKAFLKFWPDALLGRKILLTKINIQGR